MNASREGKQTLVYLPDAVKKQLRVYCAENDVSMKDVVTTALVEFFEVRSK